MATKEEISKLDLNQKAILLIELNKNGVDPRDCVSLFEISINDILEYLISNNIYHKKCTHPECKNPIKHHSEFHKKKDTFDGYYPKCKNCRTRYNKNFYKDNIEKISERNKKYYNNNSDKIINNMKDYRSDPENKIKIKEQHKEYYEDHRDKILEDHEKYRKEKPDIIKAWRKENPDKIRFYAAQRRTMEINATPKWANQEKIKKIYEEAKRLEELDGIKRHVDHIIPLYGVNEKGEHIVCGLHVEDNLQILTETENLKKSNRFIV